MHQSTNYTMTCASFNTLITTIPYFSNHCFHNNSYFIRCRLSTFKGCKVPLLLQMAGVDDIEKMWRNG